MKTFIISLVSLTAGATAGYFVGRTIYKKKYRKIADKEVESVKTSLQKYYDEKVEKLKESNKKPIVGADGADTDTVVKKKTSKKKVAEKKEDLIDKDSINYDKLKEKQEDISKYLNKSANYKQANEVKEETPSNYNEPYVITPEEYADSDYDVQTLNYYADGVLADDQYNVIKDIKNTVGDKTLDKFGLYLEDVLYVRNERYRIDYEILLDEREFKKVAPKGSATIYPGDDE